MLIRFVLSYSANFGRLARVQNRVRSAAERRANVKSHDKLPPSSGVWLPANGGCGHFDWLEVGSKFQRENAQWPGQPAYIRKYRLLTKSQQQSQACFQRAFKMDLTQLIRTLVKGGSVFNTRMSEFIAVTEPPNLFTLVQDT